MPTPDQFSLRFLFLEMFWLGASLALLIEAYAIRLNSDWDLLRVAFFFAAILCLGCALGGLRGNMRLGAQLAFWHFVAPCTFVIGIGLFAKTVSTSF